MRELQPTREGLRRGLSLSLYTVSPPIVLVLGAMFGLSSVAILYVYARSTARFRASHKRIGPIMTPIAVGASSIPLVIVYAHVVTAFGRASHPVASVGMLTFVIVWAAGCVYVALKFGPKK
jgi:hypothetical protein